jgi:hypothetical protein
MAVGLFFVTTEPEVMRAYASGTPSPDDYNSLLYEMRFAPGAELTPEYAAWKQSGEAAQDDSTCLQLEDGGKAESKPLTVGSGMGVVVDFQYKPTGSSNSAITLKGSGSAEYVLTVRNTGFTVTGGGQPGGFATAFAPGGDGFSPKFTAEFIISGGQVTAEIFNASGDSIGKTGNYPFPDGTLNVILAENGGSSRYTFLDAFGTAGTRVLADIDFSNEGETNLTDAGWSFNGGGTERGFNYSGKPLGLYLTAPTSGGGGSALSPKYDARHGLTIETTFQVADVPGNRGANFRLIGPTKGGNWNEPFLVVLSKNGTGGWITFRTEPGVNQGEIQSPATNNMTYTGNTFLPALKAVITVDGGGAKVNVTNAPNSFNWNANNGNAFSLPASDLGQLQFTMCEVDGCGAQTVWQTFKVTQNRGASALLSAFKNKTATTGTEGWALTGAADVKPVDPAGTHFLQNGLHLTGAQRAVSPALKSILPTDALKDGAKVVVEFDYIPAPGDVMTSQVALRNAAGTNDAYYSSSTWKGNSLDSNGFKSVVNGGSFQTLPHDSKVPGGGDHYYNHGVNPAPGDFSKKYRVELTVIGGYYYYVMYDENGNVFWDRNNDPYTLNGLDVGDMVVCLEETGNGGQSRVTLVQVYGLPEHRHDEWQPVFLDLFSGSALDANRWTGAAAVGGGGLTLAAGQKILSNMTFNAQDNLRIVFDLALPASAQGKIGLITEGLANDLFAGLNTGDFVASASSSVTIGTDRLFAWNKTVNVRIDIVNGTATAAVFTPGGLQLWSSEAVSAGANSNVKIGFEALSGTNTAKFSNLIVYSGAAGAEQDYDWYELYKNFTTVLESPTTNNVTNLTTDMNTTAAAAGRLSWNKNGLSNASISTRGETIGTTLGRLGKFYGDAWLRIENSQWIMSRENLTVADNLLIMYDFIPDGAESSQEAPGFVAENAANGNRVLYAGIVHPGFAVRPGGGIAPYSIPDGKPATSSYSRTRDGTPGLHNGWVVTVQIEIVFNIATVRLIGNGGTLLWESGKVPVTADTIRIGFNNADNTGSSYFNNLRVYTGKVTAGKGPYNLKPGRVEDPIAIPSDPFDWDAVYDYLDEIDAAQSSQKSLLASGGTHYSDTIPDTVDLAAMAARFSVGLTNMLILPNSDGGEANEGNAVSTSNGTKVRLYMPYGIGNFTLNGGGGFTNSYIGGSAGCWPKDLEAIVLMRNIAGDFGTWGGFTSADDTRHRDNLTLKAILEYSLEEEMDLLRRADGSMNRIQLALTSIYQVNPSAELKDLLDEISIAMRKNAVEEYDYAYAYPDWNHTVNYRGYESNSFTMFVNGGMARSLTRWSSNGNNGYADGLDLAGKLARSVLLPQFWKPDFTADWRNTTAQRKAVDEQHNAIYDGHFHQYFVAATGLLRYAEETHDIRMMEYVRDLYEYSKSFGLSNIGLYGEGCGLGDMLLLATQLTRNGVADYWDDIDRYIRNMVVEAQIDAARLQASVNARSAASAQSEFTSTATYSNGVWGPRTSGSVSPVVQRADGLVWGGITYPTHLPQHNMEWIACCPGNFPQGMYYAWSSIVTEENGVVSVNLPLNRASEWLDVDSYIPYEGKVVLKNKTAPTVAFRVPDYVNDRFLVTAKVNGAEKAIKWTGSYIYIDGLSNSDVITIEFPLEQWTETRTLMWARDDQRKEATDPGWKNTNNTGLWSNSNPDSFTFTFVGNTVIDVAGGIAANASDYRFFQRDTMKAAVNSHASAPMKTVTRFVPNTIITW